MSKVAANDKQQVSLTTLSLFAVIIGVVTGLGAIFLRMLIAAIHNLFFLGTLSLDYNANDPTVPGPYGPLVILAPVIGGLIVLFIVRRFAPEAKGHGVPEVMDSIYYHGGVIRPVVVVIKSLASALSIGSGASVGREGPIIQIGAGIGSVLGQVFKLRSWQVITLVGAGAGAGIAATFNTPLGAVMFAIELMLPEFSARTLLPVVLATGTATYMGRLAFGMEPAFMVASYQRPELFVPLSVDILPLYVLFGLIAGLGSWVFIKTLYLVEDFFDDWEFNPYLKNIVAMTSLGILFYVLMLTTGMYHTAGVGYASIQAILTGQISAPAFLMLLFVLKLLATSISLGGGASGGVFSPSLLLGAALGGAFGSLMSMAFPFMGFSPIIFALIGMAAIVGGSTGAVMTSIMMLFEMTGDYTITAPAIIAVVVAVGVRSGLMSTDIYTTKLARRGHFIPRGLRSHMFAIRIARDVMEPVAGVVNEADVKHSGKIAKSNLDQRSFAVVMKGRSIVGIVQVDTESNNRPIGPILSPVGVVRDTNFLQTAMAHMADRNLIAALVIPEKKLAHPENVVGVLTRGAIAETVMRDFRT